MSIFVPLASFFGPPLTTLPISSLLDTVEGVGLDDAHLVVQVQAETLELIVDDLLGALVAAMPSRVNTCTSMTVPTMPEGTRSEVSFTSDAFSPKIARSSFSSGVSGSRPSA